MIDVYIYAWPWESQVIVQKDRRGREVGTREPVKGCPRIQEVRELAGRIEDLGREDLTLHRVDPREDLLHKVGAVPCAIVVDGEGLELHRLRLRRPDADAELLAALEPDTLAELQREARERRAAEESSEAGQREARKLALELLGREDLSPRESAWLARAAAAKAFEKRLPPPLEDRDGRPA